jgi:hypothetical protein
MIILHNIYRKHNWISGRFSLISSIPVLKEVVDMFSNNTTTSILSSTLSRRTSPFQTLLGAVSIPTVLIPPTIQTEAYFETLYFEPLYLAATTYNEPVYDERIYREDIYAGIEPTI